ncbi:Hexaprenyldihydroxybenzoate methyltransferase, mitochondrial [Apostasia shenzhenica]|uniref:Ubiquinone biosynthesis O-methyltransferase, mitochondrial n=1 Tax=Apostasia shenzhenica TaxID=1088818 RepID=A0A2H9ZU72_9ASPA|nr:Hexaprenyldihydroxybenzoate methyltransferase, mitochondrial [Apostasia shenzhenica]
MASVSVRLCRDLLRNSARFSFKSPSCFPVGGAVSSAVLPLTPLRCLSESAPPPAPIRNSDEMKAGSGSAGVVRVATSDNSRSSLNEAELAKFAAISETWWDSKGPFKPLHLMNPTRVSFIRSMLCRHFRKDPCTKRPLEGLKIIDVGCGGGILSEPLARLGAYVTGIDALEKNINVARVHARFDSVTSSIEYICTTAEQLVRDKRKFDAVLSLEVIEHVSDPLDFVQSLSDLIAPGGATVISTINRSIRAYATAIVAAEYLLNWLPSGTHEWSKFLTPEELVLILERASISVKEMAGFVYDPLSGDWSLSNDTSVNFIAFGAKENAGAI